MIFVSLPTVVTIAIIIMVNTPAIYFCMTLEIKMDSLTGNFSFCVYTQYYISIETRVINIFPIDFSVIICIYIYTFNSNCYIEKYIFFNIVVRARYFLN